MSQEPLFLQHRTLLPSQLDPKMRRQLKSAARKIIKALEFDNCGFHCEMRLTKKGPVLLEIAARLPGGHIQEAYQVAYDVDLTDLYLDMCLGKKISFNINVHQIR